MPTQRTDIKIYNNSIDDWVDFDYFYRHDRNCRNCMCKLILVIPKGCTVEEAIKLQICDICGCEI